MFTKVLIGIDGEDGGRDALALARRLAAPDAQLVLGHVWDQGAGLAAAATGAEHPATIGHEILEAQRLEAGLDCRIAVRPGGSTGGGLHALAEELDCELLVVGSSEGQLEGHVRLPRVVRAALHGAPCAVAVAPRGFAAAGQIASVGLGYEETELGAEALAAAREIAAALHAKLHVMTVVPPLPSPWLGQPFTYVAVLDDVVGRMVRETRERLEQLGGFEADVRTGVPDAQLRELSEQVDLLVLGSRAYGPVRRMLLGSTAEAMVRDAASAVLILPGPVLERSGAATAAGPAHSGG